MTLDNLRKAALSVALLVFATGCRESVTAPDTICGADRAASTAPIQHDPILFIHGYGGNGGNFCTMIARFRRFVWLD